MSDTPRLGYVSSLGMVLPDPRSDDLPVINPATGAVIASLHQVDADEVDAVVSGAEETFRRTWGRTTPAERGRLIGAWASLIAVHQDQLTDLEVADAGHLRNECLADIKACVRVLEYFAGIADKIEGTTFSQMPNRLSYGVPEPFGVVAGINPYNANAAFVAYKAGPALAAGNCIVLKAPEAAPVLHYRMAELALQAGIPAGVLNVVSGRGHVVGPLLTEHPGIGMVAFTGGPGAGRAVISQSARNVIPVALELGGKSAVIVLPDADLATVIPSVLHSNYVKSGQNCVAGSRILVHASVYDEVVHRMASIADGIRVGLPTDKTSQMSTLISQTQRDNVNALVERSVQAGAQLLAGGRAADEGELSAGAFYRPTVLANVADDNPASTNEAFGPMASVLSYDDADHALQRANSSKFGLTAQIWGNDAATIQYLTKNLEAGSVWINTYLGFHPTVPFGGVKESGFGRENGFAAVAMYTRLKSVVWELSSKRYNFYA